MTVTTAIPARQENHDPDLASSVNTPVNHKWVKAANLKVGEHLKTSDGTDATADGGSIPADHDGWMWDLTIQDDHDFYVEPDVSDALAVQGGEPILAHNINKPIQGTCGPNGEPVFGIPQGSSGGPTEFNRITPQTLRDYNIGVNADPAEPTPMCSYCRVNPATSVDRVEARINGGNLDDSNLTPACTFCNSSKQSRMAPLNPPPGYVGSWPPAWWPARMQQTVQNPRQIP